MNVPRTFINMWHMINVRWYSQQNGFLHGVNSRGNKVGGGSASGQ